MVESSPASLRTPEPVVAASGSGTPARPIRVLELRSVRGTGGGPEKTILMGAARSDPARFAITVCYLRDVRDRIFAVDGRAEAHAVDYVEVRERHSFDPAIWPALRRLVRQRHVNIVHAHDHKTNLLALLLARREGVIPLSTVHGWTGHSRRERFLYYPVDKRLLSWFPRLIAVSGEIRAELLRVGARPERVTTVLNGIDHRAFRRDAHRTAAIRAGLGVAPADFVIGAVGRLEPQKRFDLLLQAVAIVRRRRPCVRLILVGEGSARGFLEAHALRLGLGAGCLFLGHRVDVATLHHVFDLLAQSSDYEGTPNAVLEAMAMETPVVATDVGGTRELVEHGVHGLLIAPRDLDGLAQAILSTLEEPEATARRVAAARRRVETDLSFEARQHALESIYLEMLVRPARTRPVLG